MVFNHRRILLRQQRSGYLIPSDRTYDMTVKLHKDGYGILRDQSDSW